MLVILPVLTCVLCKDCICSTMCLRMSNRFISKYKTPLSLWMSQVCVVTTRGTVTHHAVLNCHVSVTISDDK